MINDDMKNFIFVMSKNYGKANCERGWNWSPPPLHDFDLWYTLSGKGNMLLNGENYPIKKGSCFLVRPGDQPYATQDLDNRLQVIFIHFQIENKETLQLESLSYPDRYTEIIETFYFETLLNRILEIQTRDSNWRNLEFDLIMKQLFLHMYRHQSEIEKGNPPLDMKNKQLISKVISCIKEAPGYRISNNNLAEKVNLSPDYLSKLFKRHTGTPLRQFMKETRLERALYLLQETTMNVTETSDALGYQNVYFFSKQFKEHFGHPPSYFKHHVIPPSTHRGNK